MSSNDGNLKAAIIGLRHGHLGTIDQKKPGYISNFRQLDGVDVVAYCEDVATDVLNDARKHHPGASVYTSVDDLIANEDFDLACVVLPAYQIPEVGIKLAEAGKHFFMEKQFARNSDDLKPLVRAVRTSGVKVMLGYMYRFNPAMQQLKSFVEEGIFGRPLSVEARHVTTQVRPGASRDPRHFMFTNREEGGGILHMLACHNVEVMRFLMGCEATTVQAMVGRPVGYMDKPLEDLAIVAFEYENGAYGSLHAGYLAPEAADRDVALIYRGLDGVASCSHVEHNPTTLAVTSTTPAWSGAHERHFSFTLEPFHGYGNARWHHDWLQDYIRAIKQDEQPALTVDDALHVLQCIDAAYESARTGRRVEISYGL